VPLHTRFALRKERRAVSKDPLSALEERFRIRTASSYRYPAFGRSLLKSIGRRLAEGLGRRLRARTYCTKAPRGPLSIILCRTVALRTFGRLAPEFTLHSFTSFEGFQIPQL
jgi:hypothetical protein